MAASKPTGGILTGGQILSGSKSGKPIPKAPADSSTDQRGRTVTYWQGFGWAGHGRRVPKIEKAWGKPDKPKFIPGYIPQTKHVPSKKLGPKGAAVIKRMSTKAV